MSSLYLTTVLDAGARYGMHPNWSGFCGDLKYLAFEPDAEEAQRLRQSNPASSFEVMEAALYNQAGTYDFNLLVHRGMSSMLKPDLNSEAFKDLKPGLGEIEKVIQIETQTIDYFAEQNNWAVDFLKVDTEGTEHEVIEGADKTIDASVLGIRSSMNFNPAFHDQILFSATHDYLINKGFMLLNIDYFGYGYPKLGLFKKPDPSLPEQGRYGVLTSCDAVWIRREAEIKKRFTDEKALESATLKLASFCLHNNAPDVGIDLLNAYIKENSEWHFTETKNSKLYKSLRLDFLKYLGRWRTVPDETWSHAQEIYQNIFSEHLDGGSGFYPKLQAMSSELNSEAAH
ncbi:MAG: FkbM family methyltransferase [Pseudomonadota bacterium]